MPRRSDDRTILMINPRQPHPFIENKDKAEFERLIGLITESSTGRFAGAKNIVNRLAENKAPDLPNVRVAVHKFGPVPVYVLPQEHTINHLNRSIKVNIGIYPDVRFNSGTKGVALRLPFLTTKSEFVRSLDVDMGLLFQRYLEDVGEGMYDIKHHLNLAGVFDRAKEIEDVLAQSIKTKLDAVTPSLEVFQRPDDSNQLFIKELFVREQDWIFTARYARQYALYFLNELYRHIGLASRSDDYINGFRDMLTQFDALLGPGYMADARERLNFVNMLSRAIRAYYSSKRERRYDALREINIDERQPLWIRRFVQFARFVAALEREDLAPTAGRIFISCHHDVPVTEALKKQITDYVTTKFPNQVEVLDVNETGTGERFKSKIRARIWLSDTVSEIVPKNTEVQSGERAKDYLWIAREAEYGLLLGKRVIYFVEEGIDEEKVLADLRNKEERDGLIPSTARVPEGLERELIESFTEYIRAMFSVKMTGDAVQYFAPKVLGAVHQEALDAIERRHGDILVGFHQQFPRTARRTLKHIQELVSYPDSATKGGLARKLYVQYPGTYATEKDAAKAITNVWKIAERRSLLINGQPMPLMKLIRRKTYTGTLREILKHLRPDKSPDETKAWERKILEAVAPEDDPIL